MRLTLRLSWSVLATSEEKEGERRRRSSAAGLPTRVRRLLLDGLRMACVDMHADE